MSEKELQKKAEQMFRGETTPLEKKPVEQNPEQKVAFVAENIEEEASETQETSEELLEGGLSSLKSTDPTIMGQAKKLLEGLSGKVAALKEKYQRKLTSVSKPNKDGEEVMYYGGELPEVIITAEKPTWLKFKESSEKKYSKDWYIDNMMPKWSRRAGVDDTNMHPNNVKSWEEFINNKVAEDIFKNRPNFDTEYKKDRLKTLKTFSQKELEIIKNSRYAHKIEPSIWQKFEQGLLSIGNMGPVKFKNENLTPEEAKKEDTPLNILQPLSIPTKIAQSTYKEDYTLGDALKGKQNNASGIEDFATDPLNLIGIGLWAKLTKLGKFAKIEDAYQAVKGLSKEEAIVKLENLAKESDVIKSGTLATENSMVEKTEMMETVDDLRTKMKEKGVENKNFETPKSNVKKIYESPEDFYASLKPDITLEEAKKIIQTYEIKEPYGFQRELIDLGYSRFGAISNDESIIRTAYILKNKIPMPEATYLYHGTEVKNLENILTNGLDNSLGNPRNPGGAMPDRLDEGITTASADIETAIHFSNPLHEGPSQQPVILRFNPTLKERPTLSYSGTHPKVAAQDLEYSLDGGKTWIKNQHNAENSITKNAEQASGADNSFNLKQTVETLKSKTQNVSETLASEWKTLSKKFSPEYQKQAQEMLDQANKWQKDWYENPKTIERLIELSDELNIVRNKEIDMFNAWKKQIKENPSEHFEFEGLSEEELDKIYKFYGPTSYRTENQWTEIMKRIVNKEYEAQFQTKGSKLEKLVTGKEPLHTGNQGISGYNLDKTSKEGVRQNFVDKYGSKIENTAVHEGNHGLTDGNRLIPKEIQEDIVKIFGEDTKIPRRDPKTGDFKSYDEYLQNPTEVYARIMELRKYMNKAPGEFVDEQEMISLFFDGGAGKTPVDPHFFDLVQDMEKFRDLFNKLPLVLPAYLSIESIQEQNKE